MNFISKAQVLTEEIELLKEKVKDMLMASSTADPIENVRFIDSLLRLGVSYHFETDIENQLERIFDSNQNLVMGNEFDLNSTSIVFRVFRQHGFKMSCGKYTYKWIFCLLSSLNFFLTFYKINILKIVRIYIVLPHEF